MSIPTNVVRFGIIAVALLFRATAQEPAPPVYFNHTTIYVTAETYDAFKASSLIKHEFSLSRESTANANGGALTYTGFYIHGMHTSLELMNTGPSPSSPTTMAPADQIDIAMWIDRLSQLPLLRDRLELPEIKTRRNAQNQPVFDYLPMPAAARKGIETWVMAFYPDGVARGSRGTSYRPDRLFHDVVAYTITVSAWEREQLLRWFRAYGYTIREDGEKRIATGPEFTFTMLPEPTNGPRAATIAMTLNREKTGEQIYKIGDSELRFAKNRATLTFYFPQPDRH